MSLLNIVPRISMYSFIEPDYNQLIDDSIDLLRYLKENPSNESNQNHRAMKGLFWDVIIRIVNINQFQSKTKN